MLERRRASSLDGGKALLFVADICSKNIKKISMSFIVDSLSLHVEVSVVVTECSEGLLCFVRK